MTYTIRFRSTVRWDAPSGYLARASTSSFFGKLISVDDQHGVITAAMADHANNEEHKALPGLMNRLKANLSAHQMHPNQLMADSKYKYMHQPGALPKPEQKIRKGFVQKERYI